MTQTSNFIRENIVQIRNREEDFLGTGFFIQKGYCITCHHNIYRADEIFVQRGAKRYSAKWIKKYSNPKKDISLLKVVGAPFEPLNITKETYPNISVTIWGFPQDNLSNFPSGNDISGTLLTSRPFFWGSEDAEGQHEWNKKPRVKVNVLRFHGFCERGFSGAPVCYNGDGRVVGMFEALDENSGYVIPIDTVISLLSPKYNRHDVSRRTDIVTLMEKADEYYDQKDFKRAIKYYDRVINDPNYIDACADKVASLGELGDFRMAILCFDKVLRDRPKDSGMWYNKGAALQHLGRHKGAVECFDKSLEFEPRDSNVLTRKGISLQALQKYKQAKKSYDKALSIDPIYSDAWNNKGTLLDRLNKDRAALRCYNKALSIDPNSMSNWYNKGGLLDKIHKHEQALECFKQGLRIDPREVKTLDRIVQILNLLGKKDEARRVSRMLKEAKGKNLYRKKSIYFAPIR